MGMTGREIRIEGDVAYVPLTRGHVAIIDASDVPLVADWSWQAACSPKHGRVYAVSGRSKGRVSLHRLLMGDPALRVDHKDNDPLNNRRSNLRLATAQQNSRNQKRRTDNSSGYKGVSFSKLHQAWRARILVEGKRKHLGYFKSVEEAHAAYRVASEEMHGEFGRFA